MNFNAVVKIYIDQISKKSADWANFFCFTFLPLDGTVSKQHVTQRLGELCPVYRNLFLDSNWTSGEGVLSKIERVVQGKVIRDRKDLNQRYRFSIDA